jgi:hypothetical protein
VRLDPAKTRVEYGTFHGGLSHDMARGVMLAGGDAWIAGLTHSPELATTAAAPQPAASGRNCWFLRTVLEFAPCADAFADRRGEAARAAASAASGRRRLGRHARRRDARRRRDAGRRRRARQRAARRARR